MVDRRPMTQDYAGPPLDPSTVADDPLVQFRVWFDAAKAAGEPEPTVMTLATVGSDGRPSARIVLLKGVDATGFTFYTNYESRKGRDMVADPVAALVFYWRTMHRQVRVEGRVEQLTAAESDAYFVTRPRASQLGAIASPQSRVIPDRSSLERRVGELDTELHGAPAQRPPHWGGFRVVPELFELWQGQPNRLHDRVQYRRDRQLSTWIKERLAP